ncbi:MAG: DUF4012 domain-containing protein [Actinobacteria bacterium]|nr:DUF4012 domain-containing protein [Actinomycetota bacterium]
MGAARAALLSLDPDAAAVELLAAQAAVDRAARELASPTVRTLTYLPVVGDNLRGVEGLVSASGLALDAVEAITGTLDRMPGGSLALAPRDGRLPMRQLQVLAESFDRASGQLATARETLHGSAGYGLLVRPLGDARAELETYLNQLSALTEPAAALLGALPEFAGEGETRRYFVAAQSPAELRGTGGVIGAYAILTAEEGRLTLSRFAPTGTLPDAESGVVPAPNDDFVDRYGSYGGTGFWLNLNMTPDFPSAATAVIALYEHGGGERLDGVIAADPAALAALVGVTGAVDVPRVGRVEAGDVVPLLANRSYVEQTDPARRKRVLGDVAGEVLGRFMAGELTEPAAAGHALAAAADAGHLQFHATDPQVQAAFAAVGIDGRLLRPDGHYLGVFGNNAAGNKLDYYARRSIVYDVALRPDGAAVGEARVTLHNAVPDVALPRYVAGPYRRGFRAGENITLLDVYCGTNCTLRGARRDGSPATVSAGTELDQRVYGTRVDLEAGASSHLDYRLDTPGAWRVDDEGGTYTLTVQTQPTVQPTQVEVSVRIPRGMRIATASAGVEWDETTATWSGTVARDAQMEVRFVRSDRGTQDSATAHGRETS